MIRAPPRETEAGTIEILGGDLMSAVRRVELLALQEDTLT